MAVSDTQGALGFLQTGLAAEPVVRYQPHVGAIAAMRWAPGPRAGSGLLFTASHDTSIRCLDVEKEVCSSRI